MVGSLFGLAMLVLLTEPLAQIALAFRYMTYFGLGLLGLSVIVSLSGKSLLKGTAAAILGLMIATIGSDPISGVGRFTFGSPDLIEGVAPLLVMVGLFALTELMTRSGTAGIAMKPGASIRVRLPRLPVMKKIARSQGIGCAIGTFEGLTPGAGGSVAAFLTYNEARRWSKEPEKFGQGFRGGSRGPRDGEQRRGQHGSDSAAELRDSGLQLRRRAARRPADPRARAGPRLFEEDAEIVTGLYLGSFIAAVVQIVIGAIILPVCIWLVNRPRPYLAAFIYALVVSGIYTVHLSIFDVGIVIGAGLLGYFMRHFGFPVLPAVLGVVLGELIEANYRRSLLLSGGDYAIFLEDRIAIAFFVLAIVITAGSLVSEWRRAKRTRKENVA